MPSRCVAAGCSNTSSESVSVYKFPKQETLLKQWTKQVQRMRANWVPTASSTLCSEHFEPCCLPFVTSQTGRRELGGMREAGGRPRCLYRVFRYLFFFEKY
uniref:THAP domain-containing protein 1 n=1 Tax=Oryzias latipes TaxID=8090 RepID=A0A3B3HN78_ORYLA